MTDNHTVDPTAGGSSAAGPSAAEQPVPRRRRRAALAPAAVAAVLVAPCAGVAAVLAASPLWTVALLWVAAGLAVLATTGAILRAVFVTEPRLRWGWLAAAV